MLNKEKILYRLLVGLSAVTIVACANRGQGPQGGPKDELPPRMVKSTPRNGAVNVNKDRIEIDFDENIVLKEIAKNVIISPPQRSTPEIRAYGRRLAMTFSDTLRQNTTYSINFGDAIADNNEGNLLQGFVFSFATGPRIDTLQMSGTLINAEDLNPVKGVIVGIHSNLNDSAFTTQPFDRITQSADNGRFTVYNVNENRYRVYALNDQTRDYFYQPGEGVAFTDTVFLPKMENYIRQDTLWKDSLTIDTIRAVPSIRYLPNNLLIRYFQDDTKRQYLVKTERPEPHRLSLYFNAGNEQMPEIRLLNTDWSDRMLQKTSERIDTITYWLTDSLLIKKDTLSLEIKYLKSDSVFQLYPQTDTVHLFMRRRIQASSRSSVKSSKKEFLNISANLSSRFDVYKQAMLSFDTPIKRYDIDKIRLSRQVDTVFMPVVFALEKNDSIGMRYIINHQWLPEESYRLEVDSAAFFSIYDQHNAKFKGELKLRSQEDYSSLKLFLVNYDSTAVFQVVDKNDKVIRTVRAQPKGTLIKYLEPGDYYLRMFLDRNRNGKWDTGSWLEKRQPEEVFYYSKKLTLIRNWEFEETWDYSSVPLLEQKPAELKKTIDSTTAGGK